MRRSWIGCWPAGPTGPARSPSRRSGPCSTGWGSSCRRERPGGRMASPGRRPPRGAARAWTRRAGGAPPRSDARRRRAGGRGGVMADERLEEELARLRAENEALRARARRGGTLRVSDKGGVSVYGLGRRPAPLYKEQWLKLLDMADEIRAFIREHEAELKSRE